MKISRKYWLSIPCLLVILSGIIYLSRIFYDRKVSNFTGKVELYVYPGTSPDAVLSTILSSGKVRCKSSVKGIFKNIKYIKPGHYTITSSNSSMYVYRMLNYGWQSPVRLVLSGSLRLRSALARTISRQMMLDTMEVLEALRDTALLASYGFTPENVFALFMRNTYNLYWTDSMKDILNKQKQAYDKFWTDENKSKAASLGLSEIEVATVASIVTGESNYVPEYPSIAGVYLNRYRIGMKLQADPTVAYCFDYKLDRIYKHHISVDSPYNTYLHAGLPPAPICVPTYEALNAVLNPDGHKFLYFCASPELNGKHLFATSYQEHLKNAAAFRKALDNRIAEK